MSIARDAAAPSGGWHFPLFGFRIGVPWNALIGIGVLALLWYPEFTGYGSRVSQLVTAALFAVLLMGSVLVHELAHGFAARAFSYPVTGITLWAMGGYTTYRTTKRHGPAKEAVIALAGPLATLAIAGIAYLLIPYAPHGQVRAVLASFCSANLLIGIFNLLPGSPLDGGSVVKSLVWAATGSATTGQRVAGWVGRVLAGLVLVLPFLLAWRADVQPSLVAVVVGVMLAALLWSGATGTLRAAAAEQRLAAVGGASLGRPVRFVRADGPVTQLTPLLHPGVAVVAVDTMNRPVAVVNEAAAHAVPPEHAQRLTVADVSVALSPDVPVLPGGASAKDVLDACQQSGSRFVVIAAAPGSDTATLVDTDASFVTEGP